MFVVSYYENKNLLLTQLRSTIPSIGENIRIKGKNGTITNISHDDLKNVQVFIALEKIIKNKVMVDSSKKKKR